MLNLGILPVVMNHVIKINYMYNAPSKEHTPYINYSEQGTHIRTSRDLICMPRRGSRCRQPHHTHTAAHDDSTNSHRRRSSPKTPPPRAREHSTGPSADSRSWTARPSNWASSMASSSWRSGGWTSGFKPMGGAGAPPLGKGDRKSVV